MWRVFVAGVGWVFVGFRNLTSVAGAVLVANSGWRAHALASVGDTKFWGGSAHSSSCRDAVRCGPAAYVITAGVAIGCCIAGVRHSSSGIQGSGIIIHQGLVTFTNMRPFVISAIIWQEHAFDV